MGLDGSNWIIFVFDSNSDSSSISITIYLCSIFLHFIWFEDMIYILFKHNVIIWEEIVG